MKTSGFGKWRSFFWPIHRDELRKFLPMFFIFFLIAFNYNVLRSYKDTIVVTASHSGAETIPFIKLWAVLPSAVLFTLLFTRLSNWFSREKVFYITISIFIAFFSFSPLSYIPGATLSIPMSWRIVFKRYFQLDSRDLSRFSGTGPLPSSIACASFGARRS